MPVPIRLPFPPFATKVRTSGRLVSPHEVTTPLSLTSQADGTPRVRVRWRLTSLLWVLVTSGAANGGNRLPARIPMSP